MERLGWTTIVATLLVVIACSGDSSKNASAKQAPAVDPAWPPAVVPGLTSPEPDAPLGSGPGDPRVPGWPRGFRVVSAGRSGAPGAPLLAYTLETTQLLPEAAVRELTEVLARVAAGSPRIGVAADPGGTSVGQLHADDLSAALRAERRGATTVVQLLMQRPAPIGR